MNPNVGKYTYSEVKEMTIFRRYELFGCLEAEDVMRSMLKEAKDEAFTGPQNEIAWLEEMVDIHYIENN